MNEGFVDLAKVTLDIHPEELTLWMAIDFYKAVNKCETTKVVGCKKVAEGSGEEVIIFDVQVPIGQSPKNDIRYIERIAIEFASDNKHIPWVYALRRDFPKLPHLNLGDTELPRSLCIYEDTFVELELKWRPEKFIDDIINWLSLSAYGLLHQNDQPLEPLLSYTQGTIILPEIIKDGERLYVYTRPSKNGRLNLLASPLQFKNEAIGEYHIIFLRGEPQEHGVLNKIPQTIYDLHHFLKTAEIDFLKILIGNLKENKDKEESRLLVVVLLPKIGSIGGRVSGFDNYAFFTFDSLAVIGEKLKIWQKFEGELADIMFESFDINNAQNIFIGVLNPLYNFSKPQAALFNKINEQEQRLKITLIGVGSLGSQFFLHLSRMGYGEWTLIDEDILFPHNLARHALTDHIGFPKSEAVSFVANNLLKTPNHTKWIWSDFLQPDDQVELIEELKQSKLIIDMSTSIAVEREVVNSKYGKGRRISIFLNPLGNDLVILAEDEDRQIQLDILEFQFYRELLYNEQFKDHLTHTNDLIRYSNSCRDISNRIPQDHIGCFSSIASMAIRKIATDSNAKIQMWRLSEELQVNCCSLETYTIKSFKRGEWTVIVDKYVTLKMSNFRLSKLPNETGGVLIGGYDFKRRKIYIVDTILSPSDSHEYPNAYIRGIEGVEKTLNTIGEITNSNLQYVGEWHSHPKGASLNPSNDDSKLFNWLKEEMDKIGLPPLMIIQGADCKFRLFVDKL